MLVHAAVAQRHIQHALLHQNETFGHSQRIAQEDQAVVIVELDARQSALDETQLIGRAVPGAEDGFQPLHGKGVCQADASRILKAQRGEKVVAVQHMPHAGDTLAAANIVEQPDHLCHVRIEHRMALGDQTRGERDMPRVHRPRAWIALVRLTE